MPDIILGFVIRDACGRQIKATDFAIELMLDTKYFAPQMLIKNLTKTEHGVDGTGLRKLLMGVVGGSSSAISAAISNALSTDYIPQILIAAQVQAYLTKSYTEVSCAQFPQMSIKQPP